MTDRDGSVVMDQDYLPFGGDLPRTSQVEVYNEIGMEYKYTGQKEVVSIGLYYYGARYYDPEIGRFITEDTYLGWIGNPQSQNLYIYVTNNPLRYTDPTGHRLVEERPDETPSKETEEAMKKIYGDESRKISKGKNNTHIEVPNINYNPLTKSLNSFSLIGKGLWNASRERAEHAYDSPYDFVNYITIGILDAAWAGAKVRVTKMNNSVYDFANWITLGTLNTFKGAFNPDDPLISAEHWMNSLGAAGIVAGRIKMADKINPGIQSVKDDITKVYDDLFKKETMGASKISTPYGDALQEFSDNALNVKKYINEGREMFRGGKFGRSNTTEAQFWAPESPYILGYADKYGVDFDSLDYIIGGKLKNGQPFITRHAPGLGNNTGGAIEVVTNPNAVKLDFFHMP